ncbi:hypothetical protein SCG7086_AP_00160 [Chlamydiales bacterium SCGC AG-110-P3]|nr:hypothetical protein SCG7086_AP_00160 [Chlamydiales bacterium SCGC AG-110-P3]
MFELKLTGEDQATGLVADTFNEIKAHLNLNFVPNYFKALAASPSFLVVSWNTLHRVVVNEGHLSRTTKDLICAAIAHANHCLYCKIAHLACSKALGADIETRNHVIFDVNAIQPTRTREIIKFALKSAVFPANLSEVDYRALKDQGIRQEEFLEIVAVCSFACSANIYADALSLPIDAEFKEILIEEKSHPIQC